MPVDRTTDLVAWLAHIEQVHPRGMELGLERVRAVAERLDVRTPAPLCFIVGGTNGKGSTTTAIEQLLLAQGLRVGATFSPHLLRFNERIRIDGVEASDALLCSAFAAIEAARAEISLTYFEFGMLAALWCCRTASVDAAVLEVGLGGRLDAANIVDADVAVVTSIGLDHMEYLGPDREAIGYDKAHIARARRPFVVGDAAPPASLVRYARELGAQLILRGEAPGSFGLQVCACGFIYQGVRQRLVCRVQTPLLLENVGTALAALEAAGRLPDASVVARALRNAVLPGRLQRVDAPVPVYIDVAHNPHGAEFLATQLETPALHVRGETHLVLGVRADKDGAGIVDALAACVDRWWLADTRGEFAQSAASLTNRLQLRGVDAAQCASHADVASALRAALAAAHTADRIVVCGCFQAAADALQELRVELPQRVVPERAA